MRKTLDMTTEQRNTLAMLCLQIDWNYVEMGTCETTVTEIAKKKPGFIPLRLEGYELPREEYQFHWVLYKGGITYDVHETILNLKTDQYA